jgi:ribonuclease T
MELNERFRGYLPVVVDLETGGFDATVHPILEIACTFVDWDKNRMRLAAGHVWQVQPFAGAPVEPASLKVTGIDLDDPEREAIDEKLALAEFFKLVRKALKDHRCQRAILVAHNAAFDLGFLTAACVRTQMNRNPFHPFSTLDTAALAAVAYGHTVLSEACRRADMEFDESRAHSAGYDASRTAELFCRIVNAWPYDPAVRD